MQQLLHLFETYLLPVVHPFRIHRHFHMNLPLPGREGERIGALNLSEALLFSWIFAVLKGLMRIVLINIVIQSFISFQSENFPFFEMVAQEAGLTTYYFLLFSAMLDIVFFPILTMVTTEFWNWVIRLFANLMDFQGDREEVAHQITVTALSSYVFFLIPLIGELIQAFMYYIMLYAGLRENLRASRSLAFVILISPAILLTMVLCLAGLALFYLS
ncbi:MAG: hypothetical protein ACOVP4_09695 [Bacteriovoracaceae bacterium]|jgi:hypothetical protein